MEVIFVWFVMVWFMQWDDKAGIHWSESILCSGVHSIAMHAQCAVKEDIILDSGTDKGTFSVVILKPHLKFFSFIDHVK
jgi:hypothetical protein